MTTARRSLHTPWVFDLLLLSAVAGCGGGDTPDGSDGDVDTDADADTDADDAGGTGGGDDAGPCDCSPTQACCLDRCVDTETDPVVVEN